MKPDNENILSDPDWRAWLDKERKSFSFETTLDVDSDYRCGEWCVYIPDDLPKNRFTVWNLADRVKVTLELVES